MKENMKLGEEKKKNKKEESEKWRTGGKEGKNRKMYVICTLKLRIFKICVTFYARYAS